MPINTIKAMMENPRVLLASQCSMFSYTRDWVTLLSSLHDTLGALNWGAGGLVRAYSQSVSEALKQLQTTEQQITTPLKIKFPYAYQGKLDNYFAIAGISITRQSFENNVSYVLAVPVSQFESMQRDISNLTLGQIEIAT